jgi:hypothetical protein
VAQPAQAQPLRRLRPHLLLLLPLLLVVVVMAAGLQQLGGVGV